MIPLQTASPHPVTHVRFSPDGAWIAVAQPHHGVTVLERATGRVIATCAMPRRGTLSGLIFCGKYIAAANSKGLEVFDAESGAPVVQDYDVPFKGMRLAERDGAVIGFGLRAGGPVWRPEKPTEVADAFDPFMNVFRPTFTPSPDGSFALEPVHRAVKLHHLATHRCIAEIDRSDKDREATVASVFCPHSRRFALSDGYTIDVFEFPREEPEDEPDPDYVSEVPVAPMPHVRLEPVFTLRPDRPDEARGWYPPFALCADGRGLLVKRPRNRIQLWDAPTGNLLNEWSWRFEWVTCVAASADNLTAVAGGRRGRVLIWDLE